MKKKEHERYIKTPELAEILGVTEEYIGQMAREGVIPAIRFRARGHLFFRLSKVEEALKLVPEKKIASE